MSEISGKAYLMYYTNLKLMVEPYVHACIYIIYIQYLFIHECMFTTGMLDG